MLVLNRAVCRTSVILPATTFAQPSCRSFNEAPRLLELARARLGSPIGAPLPSSPPCPRMPLAVPLPQY